MKKPIPRWVSETNDRLSMDAERLRADGELLRRAQAALARSRELLARTSDSCVASRPAGGAAADPAGQAAAEAWPGRTFPSSGMDKVKRSPPGRKSTSVSARSS